MRKSSKFTIFLITLALQSYSFALENPSFFKGFTHMNEGKYDEAIMYFNISIKANPEYLPAYSHLALTYERKEDYPKAKETWQKYTEHDSYFKETVKSHIGYIDKLLEARNCLKEGKQSDAVLILEEILANDKYPMSVVWVNSAKELADIYFEQKRYEGAIPIYEKIQLYYPKDITEEMFYRYAYSYQEMKEFEKAIEVYKLLDKMFDIKDQGKVGKYKNLVSQCYEGIGDEAFALDEYKEAKETYQKLLTSFPNVENTERVREKKKKAEENLAYYYKTQGGTHLKLKEYSEAMEFYQKIIKECPESQEYRYAAERVSELNELEEKYYWDGFRSFTEKKYGECRKIYKQLLEEFPKGKHAAWAQKYIGYTYADEDKLEKAIEELLKVPRLYPDSEYADDALERAGVYYWIGLNSKKNAMKIFAYLLKKYPKSNNAPNALYYYGVLQLEAKNYRKAYMTFKKLIKEYPDSELAHRSKIQIIKMKEELQKAS